MPAGVDDAMRTATYFMGEGIHHSFIHCSNVTSLSLSISGLPGMDALVKDMEAATEGVVGVMSLRQDVSFDTFQKIISQIQTAFEAKVKSHPEYDCSV